MAEFLIRAIETISKNPIRVRLLTLEGTYITDFCRREFEELTNIKIKIQQTKKIEIREIE